jgi:hypothetical protein
MGELLKLKVRASQIIHNPALGFWLEITLPVGPETEAAITAKLEDALKLIAPIQGHPEEFHTHTSSPLSSGGLVVNQTFGSGPLPVFGNLPAGTSSSAREVPITPIAKDKKKAGAAAAGSSKARGVSHPCYYVSWSVKHWFPNIIIQS